MSKWNGITSPPVGWKGKYKTTQSVDEKTEDIWSDVTVTYSSPFVVVVYNTGDEMRVEYAVPGGRVVTMSDIFRTAAD